MFVLFGGLLEPLIVIMVDVAQLARVPGCDPGCRGFESRHPPFYL